MGGFGSGRKKTSKHKGLQYARFMLPQLIRTHVDSAIQTRNLPAIQYWIDRFYGKIPQFINQQIDANVKSKSIIAYLHSPDILNALKEIEDRNFAALQLKEKSIEAKLGLSPETALDQTLYDAQESPSNDSADQSFDPTQDKLDVQEDD